MSISARAEAGHCHRQKWAKEKKAFIQRARAGGDSDRHLVGRLHSLSDCSGVYTRHHIFLMWECLLSLNLSKRSKQFGAQQAEGLLAEGL